MADGAEPERRCNEQGDGVTEMKPLTGGPAELDNGGTDFRIERNGQHQGG